MTTGFDQASGDESAARASALGAGVFALTVAYDGAPFAGFARQPGLETVQGRIEAALETVLGESVEIVGAGRTDAGVHALGQVVSFDAPDRHVDTPALARSLTAIAGPRVAIRDVRLARRGFSARFDAISREYRYRLIPGAVPPVFLADVAWWVKGPLDLDSIREAAVALVGEHDFRSFCVTESAEGKQTVRRVEAVEVSEETQLGEECVVIRVVGNAFLHSMVRVIVGSLVEIGRGRRSSSWLGDALAAQSRAAAGPTAPAHGLTLWSVAYPEEVWLLTPSAI